MATLAGQGRDAAAGGARCNTFIGGARVFEAQCKGQTSAEYFSTYVAGGEASWQHSLGVQYGLLDGVEVETFGTMDLFDGRAVLAQYEVNIHWDISHDRPWPTRVALEGILYEREFEQDGELHHRTGAALVLGRHFGELAFAANIGLEIPDPEMDIGLAVRYPAGDFILMLSVVDEPDAGEHQVVAWPSVEWELTPRVGMALMSGFGLTAAAAPWSVRVALDVMWR